jgi:glycosyltransferase involved in cell wall biosynthesis
MLQASGHRSAADAACRGSTGALGRGVTTTISVITTVHDPFDHRVFYKEACTLRSLGYRVLVTAPHTESEVRDGIEIVALPIPRNRLERMVVTSLRLLVTAVRQRAAAYHFHDPELIPVALALKVLGKTVVYDVHEDVPRDIMIKHYIPRPLRRIVSACVGAVEQLAARWYDAIVVPTEDIRKNFAWHPRVALIRNLPIAEWYRRSAAPRSATPFRIVYAGSLSKERGIGDLVAAMARLPADMDARLTLCGAWSPSSLEDEIRTMPGFDRVDYLGSLPAPRIPDVLASADVGVACLHPTNTYETALPTKLFEYMASGLPVIVTNFPLWREIVEASGAGICVPPRDPRAIADAIERLHRDRDLRRRMSLAGKQAAERQWTWEVDGRVLGGLYSDVTGGP